MKRQLDTRHIGFILGVIALIGGAAWINANAHTDSGQSPSGAGAATDGTVTVRWFVKTPQGQKEIRSPLRQKEFTVEQDTTLGRLLQQNGVSSYNSREIANIFTGTFAAQRNQQLTVINGNWTIRAANRDKTIHLSGIDTFQLQDGDRIELIYEKQPVSTRSLPEKPDYITYVPRNASRNGKGSDDYLSCVNNRAVHRWAQDFQRGTAEKPDYPFNPPVCGAHVHRFPPTGQHDVVSPTDKEKWVLDKPITPIQAEMHILGHGMTIVQYHPDKLSQDTVQQLEQWVTNHSFVYLAPYPDMDASIALTRWGMSAKLDRFNRSKLEQFQQAPYNILPPMHGSLQYLHTAPHFTEVRGG